jgi:hypothetical protein
MCQWEGLERTRKQAFDTSDTSATCLIMRVYGPHGGSI